MKTRMKHKSLITAMIIACALAVNAESRGADNNQYGNKFEDPFARAHSPKPQSYSSSQGIPLPDNPEEDDAAGEKNGPVGDAPWMFIALGLGYGIYLYEKKQSVWKKAK